MNRRRRKMLQWLPWFKNQSLALNNVYPSLVHQYGSDRYYNSVDGATAFPFTSTRTTNATMFDNQGRLVWAPANMIPQSSTAGAVVGVIGSGGALPTGWFRSTATGITHEVLAVAPDYIDVRIYGTNSSGGTAYPQISPLQVPLSIVPFESYSGSMTLSIIGGSTAGFSTAVARLNTQWLISGSYNNEASQSAQATATPTRLVSQGQSTATANQVRLSINLSIPALGVVDITLRMGLPQVERQGVDSPKPYIQTTGTAIYCARREYVPGTLEAAGLLIEQSRVNSVTNSAMIGGVAPSTIPTGWNATAVAGITQTYAYGTEYGMPYIDITYSGTNTSGATAFPTVFLGTLAGGVAAANGQAWSGSIYVRKIAGSTSITTLNHVLRGRAAGALVSGQSVTTALSDDINLTVGRKEGAFTFTDPSITHVEHCINTSLLAAATYDITIRIGGPQLELGSLATSLIPTFGTAATRAVDLMSITPTDWFTPENVIYIEYESYALAGFNPMAFSLDDNTTLNRIYLTGNTGTQSSSNAIANVEVGIVSVAVPNLRGTYRKVARRNETNNHTITADGTLGGVDVSGATTTGLTHFRLGGSSSGSAVAVLNGHIKEVRFYQNTLASNAQMQTLTT